MRSALQTGLTLTEFAEIFSAIHPWKLAQIGFGEVATPSLGPTTAFPGRQTANKANCGPCVFEYGYQDGRISRTDIVEAIAQAELLWANFTGFWPSPRYFPQEEIALGNDCRRWWADCCDSENAPDPRNLLQLNWGYVQSVGRELLTLLNNNVAVTRNDADADTIAEVFTSDPVPVPDCTVGDDVRVFFRAADRLDQPLEEWEIRPVRVVIDDSGGAGNWTATINGPAYLLVQPARVLVVNPECQFAVEDDTYVDGLEVYLRSTDTSQQGVALWNDGCAATLQVLCASDLWKKQGLITAQSVTLESEDPVDPCEPMRIEAACVALNQTECPQRLLVNYRAGYPLKNGRMDRHIGRSIAYLAAALLARNFCGCGCDEDNDILGWYRSLRLYGAKENILAVSMKQIENPFGPERGAIMAWETAKNYRLRFLAGLI
jgi:hypothetical protein